MGWFQKLGNTIKNGAQRLGQHVSHGVDQAPRLVDHVAHAIDTEAGKVASVAGTVAKYAGMASVQLLILFFLVGNKARLALLPKRKKNIESGLLI
jgi:hypothetical protein